MNVRSEELNEAKNAARFAEQVGVQFDQRAEGYDNPVTAFVGERELRQVRQLVPEGATVLDYGCGTGRTTLDLVRRGCRVTAYDISAQMLAVARAKCERLGQGIDLPCSVEFVTNPAVLGGRVWPVITCIGVLDYYRDPLPLLQTLRDYLQEDGQLVVTYPNALSPLCWLYLAGSQFTIPARARTPAAARAAALRVGLQVTRLGYAFPAIRPLGHTLIVAMKRNYNIRTDHVEILGV